MIVEDTCFPLSASSRILISSHAWRVKKCGTILKCVGRLASCPQRVTCYLQYTLENFSAKDREMLNIILHTAAQHSSSN